MTGKAVPATCLEPARPLFTFAFQRHGERDWMMQWRAAEAKGIGGTVSVTHMLCPDSGGTANADPAPSRADAWRSGLLDARLRPEAR